MSERAAIALAGIAWVAAWHGASGSGGMPLAAGVAAVGLALAMRRPWLLVLAFALLVDARAAADRAGLERPIARGPVEAWATLVTDPAPAAGGASRAEVRLGGRHLQASATGAVGAQLSARAAGQRILVRGRTERAPPRTPWLEQRHVAGVLRIDVIDAVDGGRAPARWANALRSALDRSAAALPPDQRALYLGFVLGDDRGQAPQVVDDFRGAGLSHLLAVSGQNVAFTLALAAPLLRRAMLRWRWALTLLLIAFFALVTRFEPSVLRASVMAGLAATATMLGREASGRRVLALSVAFLLVGDPFLASSVGFQLSVAASASILMLSKPLARLVPGPAWLRDAIGVSIAAQAGVGPLLAATFGSAPVAGLVANLLAVPLAGPLMVWGFGAGLVGGLLGRRAAAVLHLPTRLMIAWVARVASAAAGWPLGRLAVWDAGLLALAVLAVATAERWSRPLRRASLAGAGLLAALALVPALATGVRPPPVRTDLGGAELWRAGGSTVLVVGRRPPPDLLAALREAGAAGVDVAVLQSAAGVRPLAVAAERVAVRRLVRPEDVAAPTAMTVGPFVLELVPVEGGVAVSVTAAQGRDPPV